MATVYPCYKIKDNDTYDDNFEDDPPSLEVAYNTEMISNTFTTNAESAGITGIETHRHLGEKRYEIKDHLGNVRAVTSDIKNASNYNLVASSWKFLADISSLNNYHPYGSLIDAGSWSGSSYNYGYNGMLKEGIGKDISHTHFRNLSVGGFVGWWSPDPLEYKFPSMSTYASMGNNPIRFTDIKGDKIASTQEGYDISKEGLDATLGEANPFKYDTDSGLWYEEEGFDPSGLNEAQSEVYDKVSSVIKSEKTANIVVVDLNQKFFSNFYNKETSLDEAGGLGLNDVYRKYDDKLGQEVHFTSDLTNIYIARDLNYGYKDNYTNIRGLTALHELGHIFYYFNYPNMLPTENLFCTSAFELQTRQIYMMPINKLSMDSFLNLFRQEKVLSKPLGGKPTWHDSEKENKLAR